MKNIQTKYRLFMALSWADGGLNAYLYLVCVVLEKPISYKNIRQFNA
jgi:hypothetical protein